MKCGVAILHYNRVNKLQQLIQAVKMTVPNHVEIIVCDDGSINEYKGKSVNSICIEEEITLIQGPNKGVSHNKNRALFSLQNCDYITLLEDDLFPNRNKWMETYVRAAQESGIHHFCRVQEKKRISLNPEFDKYMARLGLNPLYGQSPRGDLTFITKKVLTKVGAFNPRFMGAGFAHGEWSERIWNAGLIGHPNKWVDIREACESFTQIGDTKGGRWNEQEKIKEQLERNRKIYKELKRNPYVKLPLTL